MSKFELANKIVRNFIKDHPHLRVIDIIREKYDICSAFSWWDTDEGVMFWLHTYDEVRGSKQLEEFLEKYYFNNTFINLEDFA